MIISKTSRRPYNQVGGGVEALGKKWNARINLYVPVGKKKKNIYRFSYTDEEFGLKAREQFALKGVDSLAGYRFCKTNYIFRVGAGPYFYWGNSTKTTNAFSHKLKQTFGGRLSGGLSFMDYIFLDGIASYDAIFKWSAQGSLTLSLPFDFTFKSKRSLAPFCLRKRLYEPVERNEIIAVDRINRFTDDARVLDPEFEP